MKALLNRSIAVLVTTLLPFMTALAQEREIAPEPTVNVFWVYVFFAVFVGICAWIGIGIWRAEKKNQQTRQGSAQS